MDFLDFLTEMGGDMVERGLILAAIVVVAVTLWFSIGNKLAGRINTLDGSI